MSSEEDNGHDAQARSNKRRRMRACDMCRRRKVRCDGGAMPGNTCNNCIAFKYTCTYVEGASKRVPDAGYVESLETQIVEMRKTLDKYLRHSPNIALMSSSYTDSQTPMSLTASGSEASTPALHPHQQLHACITPFNSSLPREAAEPEDLDSSEDEVSTHKKLVASIQDITIHPRPGYDHHDHFLGKSSSMMFLQTAMDMREEYVGAARVPAPLIGERRPVFWSEHPWVAGLDAQTALRLVFPDAGLVDALVALYFAEFNLYLPLLHRPTFEAHVRARRHRRDADFGCVLLLVCALGARFSDDPRVLLDDASQVPPDDGGAEEEEDNGRAKKWRWHAAGWKWFIQVQDFKSLLNLKEPTLLDLQILCLASTYVHGTSSPHISWGYIGVGIRYAQDLGAHRKKVYNDRSSVDRELLKRAFWILLYLDRAISALLGRPCGIQDEDIDVDLPIACDDEYWINPDPNLAFKQPEGKPSTMVFFNCALRLAQIYAFALRTIYSINKSKVLLGLVGPKWEQHIVAELDSTMNRWIDSVPDHLRWNPHMENLVFLSQSALLYASYYALQIAVHRPFIPSPRKPSGISFPSLAICTNAARSCIHVLDVHTKRVGYPSPHTQAAMFSSAIVLLVHIWGAKRSGSTADPVKEMKEVHKVMDMFRTLEPRWYSAGRVWDLLYNLANVGDLPLPEQSARLSHKRVRGTKGAAESSPSSDSMNSPGEARHMAGTRRVQQYQQNVVPGPSSFPGDFSFTLPTHGNELGRLPLHPFFDPSTSVASPSSPQLVQSEATWSPVSFGAIPGLSPPVVPPLAGSHVPGEPVDAASLEAIFSMFPPVSYPDVSTDPVSQNADPAYPQSLMSVLNENLESMMAQTGTPDIQEPVAQNSLDDGALAMWSDAPTGFEWEDWSSYVNNFGSAEP